MFQHECKHKARSTAIIISSNSKLRLKKRSNKVELQQSHVRLDLIKLILFNVAYNVSGTQVVVNGTKYRIFRQVNRKLHTHNLISEDVL